MVLIDKAENQYYFIQVKRFAQPSQRYLYEQLRHVNTSYTFYHGVEQLQNFRKQFQTGYVRDRLDTFKQGNDYPLRRATINNSHFVFLHNLPYLSFLEKEGVLFYEWNFFRNIIDNHQVIRFENGELDQLQSGVKPVLHNPLEIVKQYFSNGEYGASFHNSFRLYLTQYSKFSVGKVQYSVKKI